MLNGRPDPTQPRQGPLNVYELNQNGSLESSPTGPGCLEPVEHSCAAATTVLAAWVMDRELTSAQRLLKVQGALVAVPFYVKATGYKAHTAPGFRPKLQSETTNRAIQKQVREGSGAKKPLGPYSLTAPRNRPKDTLTNVVGTRHKLHPCIKAERYRGSSRVQLIDGDPESKRPWRTTNQVFAACARVQDTIGLANPGISSDVALRLHKQQGIYGK